MFFIEKCSRRQIPETHQYIDGKLAAQLAESKSDVYHLIGKLVVRACFSVENAADQKLLKRINILTGNWKPNSLHQNQMSIIRSGNCLRRHVFQWRNAADEKFPKRISILTGNWKPNSLNKNPMSIIRSGNFLCGHVFQWKMPPTRSSRNAPIYWRKIGSLTR